MKHPHPASPARPSAAAFRSILGLAALAGAALSTGNSARADTPLSAYSIANNVGINARFGLNAPSGQAYRDNIAPLSDALGDLGVRHIRSAVGAGFESYLVTALSGNNRHILLCGVTKQTTGDGSLDSSPAAIATALNRFESIRDAGRLRYIEGPNEWHINHGSEPWAADLADFQRKLYAAARQGSNSGVNGSYAGYTVVQASVGAESTAAYATALANVTGKKADWGMGHVYGGSATSFDTRFTAKYDDWNSVPPGDPFVLTETGLSTTPGVGLTVNEEVKGKYLARLFMDVASWKPTNTIQTVYYFELYEAATNSGAATTMGLIERDTLVRKRSFYIFRNMLWLLGSNNASNLNAVGISVSNAPSNLQRRLIRRADGVYLLFLYRDNVLWSAGSPVADPDTHINVTITSQANRTVRIYRPAGIGWNDSGTCSARNQPTATVSTNGSGVLSNVPVNGGMTVLEFKTGTNSLPAVRTGPPSWTPGL